MKKIILVTFLLMVTSISERGLAWDNNVTHPDISKYAAEQSALSKDKGDYLKFIGIDNGLKQELTWANSQKTIKDWIADGAKREDGSFREFNHFHNPLKPWLEAGLHIAGFIPFGESAVLWSQDCNAQANWSNGSGMDLPYPGIITISDNTTPTDWSWDTTRNYFYAALTGQAKADREANFAKTFFGLGHQIHLLQDMSVPMHVRNNQHLIQRMIEGWVLNNESRIMSNLATTPILMPTVALEHSINGKQPVAGLFDTGRYLASNGTTSIALLDTSYGLAEWTNANFLSDDTIFWPEFPHPAKADTNAQLIEVHAEDGITDNRLYISLNGQDYKLAAYSYFHDQVSTALDGWNYILDEKVYDDYQKFLLPRAVGYSAGLLNYFFRGDIDMTADPSTAGQSLIKNNSNEDMSGTFSLYYDDTSDNRVNIANWDLSINAGQSAPLTFSIPDSTIQVKEKNKYFLVFNGTLGNENGAVVAKKVTVNSNVDGRVVILYNMSQPDITVLTKSGVLTTTIPGTFVRAFAVRFDLDDYNTFVVMTYHSTANGYDNYGYDFHKFIIDEPNKTISYQGVVMSIPGSQDTSCAKICDYYPYSYYDCNSSSHQYSLNDFYFKDGNIKPFGKYTENFSHSISSDGEGGMTRYLDGSESRSLYFGSPVQTLNYSWSGGHFDCENDANDSSAYFPDAVAYIPGQIFNESDYSYSTCVQDSMWGACDNYGYHPVPGLPSIDIAGYRTFTMLRKDGKYSVGGREQSFGSEIGLVNCPYFLIAEGNTGWHIGTDGIKIVNFQNCSQWQTLHSFGSGLNLAIGPYPLQQPIFDVSPVILFQ